MHRRQNPARRRRRDDIIRHPLHLHLRTGKTGIIAPNMQADGLFGSPFGWKVRFQTTFKNVGRIDRTFE